MIINCRGNVPSRAAAWRSAALSLWQPRIRLMTALTLCALPCYAAQPFIEGAAGIIATVDENSGRYEVRSRELNWAFAGQLGDRASNLKVLGGRDRLGAYRELQFTWRQRKSLSGTIRTYADRAVVLFGITSNDPVTEAATIRFPDFTEVPKDLHHFSYKNDVFAPYSFSLEQTGTPWLLFDDALHAVVLSPASNFMIASMLGDGTREIASGLNAQVTDLPAAFVHTTLMAFGIGVNATWDTWGMAITTLQGKTRPANDADVGLRYLGYWTDNGAAYYYAYDQQLGYANTLKALVQRYRNEGIPIGYLQLDSWWYFKSLTGPGGEVLHTKNPDLPAGEWNRYGGLLKYEAHPVLFPFGLARFQKEIGLPLITHNRWIDPESPYRQHYDISGVAAVDPGWWNEIMTYISSANVVTYEQDWLNVIYQNSPALAATAKAGDAFTDGMARTARARGLSLQYCMALPRYFLQSAHYDNVTTIRTSGDRLTRSKWASFLYASRLASALGIWPWTDVFMSTEADNLLVATLSAGMVGIGDSIGTENKENLLRAVRTDGIIVKPDSPLLPIDAAYTADSLESGLRTAGDSSPPMVAAAHTNHGRLLTSYVFAFSRASEDTKATVTAAQLGMTGDAYLYDSRSGSGRRLAQSEPITIDLGPNGTSYYVLTSVSRAGIALFGDESKLVPDGKKRIASLVDEPNRLTATVTFALQEKSLRLFGYATRRPRITALLGTATNLVFDATTGRFDVSVSPSPQRLPEGSGSNRVRHAIISIRSG